MKEITISVGLNDAVTKRQEYETEMYVDVMKKVLRKLLPRIYAPFSTRNPS